MSEESPGRIGEQFYQREAHWNTYKMLVLQLVIFCKIINNPFFISFYDKNCKHIAATCSLRFLTSNKPEAQLFSGKLCVAKTFIFRRSCDHTCGEEIQIIGLYGSEGRAEVGYVTFKIRRTCAKTGFAQIVELHTCYE